MVSKNYLELLYWGGFFQRFHYFHSVNSYSAKISDSFVRFVQRLRHGKSLQFGPKRQTYSQSTKKPERRFFELVWKFSQREDIDGHCMYNMIIICMFFSHPGSLQVLARNMMDVWPRQHLTRPWFGHDILGEQWGRVQIPSWAVHPEQNVCRELSVLSNHRCPKWQLNATKVIDHDILRGLQAIPRSYLIIPLAI